MFLMPFQLDRLMMWRALGLANSSRCTGQKSMLVSKESLTIMIKSMTMYISITSSIRMATNRWKVAREFLQFFASPCQLVLCRRDPLKFEQCKLMRQWTVLPHKNVEILGWVSQAQERVSGEAAALKRSGRDLAKKCSLLFPKSKVHANLPSGVSWDFLY